jgi:hypothetical protein
MCFSARSESERVDGQGGRNGSSPGGAGIVHILKFYGFYEVVYGIPWLGASFAKICGTPEGVTGCDCSNGQGLFFTLNLA